MLFRSAVIVNKQFWDALPAELRSQLETAMAEATDYANKIAKEKNDQDLESVRKTGKTEVTVLSAAERAEFKKVLVPVNKEMESRIGKDILEATYKATGFTE